VLPLTLAILDAQLVQVGGQVYAIPLVSIVESLRPRPGEVRAVLGHGEVLNVRGEVLPILRLHELLGVAPAAIDPSAGLLVIVESDRSKVAVLVDQLLEQQQVVIKNLEINFRRVEGIAAATILGDGRVALIVDVPALIGMARAGVQRAVVTASPAPHASALT
jgi:two-component system chemotaxis sensor kinase CheA